MLSTHGNSRVEEEGKEFSGLFFPCFPVLRESKCIDVHPRCTVQTDQILPFLFFPLSTTASLALAASQSGTKKPLPLFIPLP